MEKIEYVAPVVEELGSHVELVQRRVIPPGRFDGLIVPGPGYLNS